MKKVLFAIFVLAMMFGAYGVSGAEEDPIKGEVAYVYGLVNVRSEQCGHSPHSGDGCFYQETIGQEPTIMVTTCSRGPEPCIYSASYNAGDWGFSVAYDGVGQTLQDPVERAWFHLIAALLGAPVNFEHSLQENADFIYSFVNGNSEQCGVYDITGPSCFWQKKDIGNDVYDTTIRAATCSRGPDSCIYSASFRTRGWRGMSIGYYGKDSEWSAENMAWLNLIATYFRVYGAS